jgi:xylan 1,4-beta-xylosidase
MIRNPILKGFNPDPSIFRVGPDYYIATSTFEWFPGVQIHHSRDLVNWRLVTRPLTRAAQLDMRGNPDSCGVWAPCLSHADGQFWLIYTDVKRLDGNFKDAHNYLVTAPEITGPWSDPIYLNSSGFDPSLFHDDDGRKWLLNQQWKHTTDSVGGRPKDIAFDGILAQEYDPVARHLTGPITNIFAGSLGVLPRFSMCTIASNGAPIVNGASPSISRPTPRSGPSKISTGSESEQVQPLASSGS